MAGPEDARPPGLPSVEELKALNQRIHDDAGSPELFNLDQPSALESCLARARAAYSDSPEGVIRSAAVLAHGIAQAQAFTDGNRRSAFTATRYFLVANGFGYLTSETDSDHILARYLNQVVESPSGSPPGPRKFEELFRRRLRNRKPPERSH
jgi:prophage maintenance system killer protein